MIDRMRVINMNKKDILLIVLPIGMMLMMAFTLIQMDEIKQEFMEWQQLTMELLERVEQLEEVI